MKTLLLTGGTGFFGRSILDAFGRGLLAPFGIGRIVAVARHASHLRVEAPGLCGAAIELVDADVLRLDSTFDADVLIHAAASSDARRYRVDPAGEARIIVEGTRRVCEVVRSAARRPHLLYVSSGAVYGRQPAGVAALGEGAPQTPDADPDKATYAQAKRAAEAIVRDLAESNSVPVRIARCFAFIGPWLPLDQHFAIGNFIGNALRGEPIEVRARHPVIRSYLHADDLAVWLLRLATAEGERCETFNVGSDEAISIRDLASLVAEVGAVGVLLDALPAGGIADAAVRTDRYVPDVGKARDELGLAVTIPLREAVERTLKRLAEMSSPRPSAQAREPARIPR